MYVTFLHYHSYTHVNRSCKQSVAIALDFSYFKWLFLTSVSLFVFGMHRMHEMLTILTDVRGVCKSVCLSRGLHVNWQRRVQWTPRAVCTGSFGAAFVKLL